MARNLQQRLSHASYDYVHLNRRINKLYNSCKEVEKAISGFKKKEKIDKK